MSDKKYSNLHPEDLAKLKKIMKGKTNLDSKYYKKKESTNPDAKYYKKKKSTHPDAKYYE